MRTRSKELVSPKMIDFIAVGARTAQIRAESKLSQSDFAARLGVSLRAYQSYERAERELPFTFAIRLYQVFGISPVWLALGPEGGPKRLLTPEESVRLSSDLYDAWQCGLEASHSSCPPDFRKTLYRKLSRSTFQDGAVPVSAIAETIEDIQGIRNGT